MLNDCYGYTVKARCVEPEGRQGLGSTHRKFETGVVGLSVEHL